MGSLSADNITVMFLALGILLGCARLLGELAQKFHQPAVLGELLAGVLLGPTVLGTIAPDLFGYLFPATGPNAIALGGITLLSVALFLLVAGLEVDLSTIGRQGKIAPWVSISGIVLPFAIGFAAAWIAPEMLGRHNGASPLIFALFLATALAISALPVIAKTLMDLDLYRTDFGMIIISAAIFDDLTGWIIFAIILGLMGTASDHSNNIVMTIVLTLAFAGFMLTAGRWLIHRTLPFLQAYSKRPGGVLSFAITLALLGAALAEWIGIHAIFGAFLVGVAVGASPHLREHTRTVLDKFVSSIFAPLFFASIGLKVNFVQHFDLALVVTIILIACVCKLAGGTIGARLGGMPKRDSWAVGFAMNARGAMEIVLGILALQAGIIDDRLFVALVVMAIFTSMISGPMIRVLLQLGKKKRLIDALSSKTFVRDIKSFSREGVIMELTESAALAAGLDQKAVYKAVWEREAALPTGIGKGIALPHARLAGITRPIVAIGISEAGVDFDAPDGEPAHVIFLILTHEDDPGAQLEISSEIAHLFREHDLTPPILRTKSYTEFLALLKNTLSERRATA